MYRKYLSRRESLAEAYNLVALQVQNTYHQLHFLMRKRDLLIENRNVMKNILRTAESLVAVNRMNSSQLLKIRADISDIDNDVLETEGNIATARSMHPQVIRQEPGNCPICNMKLTYVPGKENQEHEHTGTEMGSETKNGHEGHEMKSPMTFSLADTLLQNANVYTVPVKLEAFESENTYSGHVDYNEDPSRLAIVNTKYGGWVEKLYVTREGQWISRGKPLAAIYSPVILAAKEEYLTIRESLKAQYTAHGKDPVEIEKDPTLIASRRKLLNLDVPLYKIKELEKTGSAGRLSYLTSPISGVVIRKDVLRGTHVKPGQEIFRVANLGILWSDGGEHPQAPGKAGTGFR